ncbi:MAG: substrate-binding domain-containing protein [Deltaproteobacteria bacterium]|nr:substrate-binding domain-containing protein [Deltaproteobacteria bacterium]
MRVALVLVSFLAAVAIVVAWVERGETPPHLTTPRAELEAGGDRAEDETLGRGLHLAGSGSNLVVTRALAAAYRTSRPNDRVVVHDSIGSTGGVRAVASGAIAIGLVARPLRPAERELGLSVVGYARVPITFLAHPDVRDGDISSDEIVRSLRGESVPWRDGTPRVWLLRERGDAGSAVVASRIEGFGDAEEDAIATRRFRVVYHDDELTRAILGLRGGLGIADLAQARANAPTARVLAVDGRMPSVVAVSDGSYPFFKDLSFVVRNAEDPSVARFLAFATSEQARQVIASAGAAALPLEAP